MIENGNMRVRRVSGGIHAAGPDCRIDVIRGAGGANALDTKTRFQSAKVSNNSFEDSPERRAIFLGYYVSRSLSARVIARTLFARARRSALSSGTASSCARARPPSLLHGDWALLMVQDRSSQGDGAMAEDASGKSKGNAARTHRLLSKGVVP